MEKETIDCNIIIPTYNRPDYLRRILHYYRNFGSCFDIIVADSSSAENKKINRDTISSLSGMNILYLDNYSPNIVSHDKFADMVQFAQKKYCVICADDDFITPGGIKKAIEFLERNPDFVLAHGLYFLFFLNNEIEENQNIKWRPLYLNSKSIDSNSVEERIVTHFSDYYQTLYAVHRTSLLKMVYKDFLAPKIDPLLFGEFLPDMLKIIYGKTKCLDVFYMARQAGSRCGYWPELTEFIQKGIYDQEYNKFKECLVQKMRQKTYLNDEKAEKIIDMGMSIYLRKNYPKGFLILKLGRYKGFSDFLPLYIFSKVKALYRKVFKAGEPNKFLETMENPFLKGCNDFKEINSYLRSSKKS